MQERPLVVHVHPEDDYVRLSTTKNILIIRQKPLEITRGAYVLIIIHTTPVEQLEGRLIGVSFDTTEDNIPQFMQLIISLNDKKPFSKLDLM